MKVSTEQRADRQAVVQIEVEPSELEAAMDRAYRRLVRQVNINGFRPGKAPRHIVERRLGKAVLLEEAAQELVPKLTDDAIKEQEIDAIGAPQIEIIAQDPLTFTATIPLRPVVLLGDYAAVRVPSREVVITEAQVDEVIDRLRRQRGEWVTPEVERLAQDGDQVTFDLGSSVDGEALEDTQRDTTSVLGEAGGLLPELQASITTLALNESTQVAVAFPEDAQQERIAGKEVLFDLTLTSIKERHLPPLDDEFVTTVSDLTTVEALRERVRGSLKQQEQETARQQVTQAVIDLVTDSSTIEMPPILIDNQVERQLEERRQVFERQGLSWKRLLELTNRTEGQVNEDERPLAERRVRSSLALMEVAKQEAITVAPEEVNAEIDLLAAGAADPAAARRQYEQTENRQAIESRIFEQRILDRLIEIATEGRGPIVGPGEATMPMALIEAVADTVPADVTDAATTEPLAEVVTDTPAEDEPK